MDVGFIEIFLGTEKKAKGYTHLGSVAVRGSRIYGCIWIIQKQPLRRDLWRENKKKEKRKKLNVEFINFFLFFFPPPNL